jgi:hypothetical protein
MQLARLKEFRQAAYQYLCRAHDATKELTDAILDLLQKKYMLQLNVLNFRPES